MKINDETSASIGIALNEAILLNAEYDPTQNVLMTSFRVLTLPDNHSSEPDDPRRVIALCGIGRIAAALRNGHWNDFDAPTISFQTSDLPSVIQGFGGQPIYGRKFINVEDEAYDRWKDRLSLDITPVNGSVENRINLFQDGSTTIKFLDIWIWFSSLSILDLSGNTISLSDFIAGGKSWWDAMYAGDKRTYGHGIVPG